MPTIVQVKVNTPGTTTRGNSNMIQLTGFDYTNSRGFKKLFFEEKQHGGRTENAEVTDTLSKDDWVEITMDDTQYNNVTNIRKISEPAGAVVPDSTQGKPGGGGAPTGGNPRSANGSDKMTKADWAEKDRKKEVSVSRSVAIKSAALLIAGLCAGKGAVKGNIASLEKLTYRLEAYLMKGDFEAELAAEPVALPPDKAPAPVNTSTPIDSGGAGGSPGPEDDDIPF